ncbi:hypothetical protein BDA96_07G111600 [Sorghum bicolor]|uniref:Uncharacterized protein n=2 Tax=Sorghum bicolor TaxID=4558 RepID=A0A921U9E8_SORBI|nr:hypothetical protein BDA96_07G111600 [Sorghum bicolor]KAG0523299.1 hypothetical protein BDA96_07G111600 [Sorghum bicolor]KXG24968.1 hypothetical protein SORBI_3007G105000 [Sorghum bicolor]
MRRRGSPLTAPPGGTTPHPSLASASLVPAPVSSPAPAATSATPAMAGSGGSGSPLPFPPHLLLIHGNVAGAWPLQVRRPLAAGRGHGDGHGGSDLRGRIATGGHWSRRAPASTAR